jgi:ribose/xylose/arabinose/galactoside ABC-type transport system permease subunit
MRVIVAALATIGSAGISAWLLAWNNCVNLLPGRPQFDVFCGHNVLLQLVPLFFLLLILFAIFAGIILRQLKRRRRESTSINP